MRSRAAFMLVALVACKGDEQPASAPAPTAVRARPAPPDAALVAELPEGFPLPTSPTRRLVRASARLPMQIWEYEYDELAPADAIKQLLDGLIAASYKIGESRRDGFAATRDGTTYRVSAAARGRGAALTLRALPEAGPTVLPAPAGYPTSFPFVGGGTAAHAPEGGALQVAYQLAPADLELVTMLAGQAAGWQCAGSGKVTCTKDAARVTFSTQAAPDGSILVVETR
jgi:hypothetical protein